MHQGAACALADWRQALPRPSWRGGRGARDGVRWLWRVLRSGPALALIGGIAISTVLILVALSDRFAGFGLILFSPIFVPLITAGLLAGRGLLGLGGRLPEAMRSAMLVRGRCPACGYGLGGVPQGEGGLVGCPECQAKWEANALFAARAAPEVVVISDW